MRNIRKLFAVILAIATMLTSMTFVFADTTPSYYSQAMALYDIGLYKGQDPDEFKGTGSKAQAIRPSATPAQ